MTGGETVHALVRQHAATAPHSIAVAAPDATLTYGELIRSADGLTERLLAMGVRAETPIGLCLPPSAALIAAIVGIVGSGGAHLALDPTHPPGRLRTVLADSGAPAVVCGTDPTGTPDGVVPLRFDPTASGNTAPVALGARSAGIAYVIYTSGSTGAPNGVLIEHQSLRLLIDWHHRAFGLGRDDRVATLAGPAFDASVWEIWATLTAGAALHVPPRDVRPDPVALWDWLVRERITVAFAPTLLAEELMRVYRPPAPALRILLTGGDVLHRRPPADLPFRVVNNYGLTEATVVSTSGDVHPGGSGAPDIGTPVDHARVHIVDDDLAPVPDGVRGHLLLGGPALARGYLGRPALTAARFIPDHLGGRPGARLLWTGDLARRLPGGEIEFQGRADDQISHNGHRIEPAEVCAALTRHPSVRSAVVVADRDAAVPRLLAYLVADGQPPPDQTMIDFAADLLPAHMVPGEFVWLDHIPLTANGKADRAMLPRHQPSDEAGHDDESPTELEAALVPVVADVLALPTVAVDTNFFRLGGHSMLAAQLMLRIRETYDVDVDLRFVFDNPTVRQMAERIEALLVAEVAAMSDAEAAHRLDRT